MMSLFIIQICFKQSINICLDLLINNLSASELILKSYSPLYFRVTVRRFFKAKQFVHYICRCSDLFVACRLIIKWFQTYGWWDRYRWEREQLGNGMKQVTLYCSFSLKELYLFIYLFVNIHNKSFISRPSTMLNVTING